MSGTEAPPDRGLYVLNSGGHDQDRMFPGGAGSPSDPGHPPVNFHAYAACTRGGFVRSIPSLPASAQAVLVLLRPRHLWKCLREMRVLRSRGLRVLVSWKESGLAQVSGFLSDRGRWMNFLEIAMAADGYISSTEDLVPVYQGAGFVSGGFVPTPYPVDSPAWDFSRPLSSREGVFVGTREFGVPARSHLAALAALESANIPATVINVGGCRDMHLLKAISKNVRIVDGPLPYREYLSLMSGHRVVFQADRGSVPGQVAGDALICRTPCVGGDGAIERIAFPDTCGFGRTIGDCLGQVQRLLNDDKAWTQCSMDALKTARKHLGFDAVRTRLDEFLW